MSTELERMDRDTAIVGFDPEAMMEVGSAPAAQGKGRGAEAVDSGDIILPRLVLLQGLSPAVTGNIEGAKMGTWWLLPMNRPVNIPGDPKWGEAKIAVVRVFPAQRLWRNIKDGGGIMCSSNDGSMRAAAPEGLAGAALKLEIKKDKLVGKEWEGGTPTDDCYQCVRGPGACAAALQKLVLRQLDRKGTWLPKKLNIDEHGYVTTTGGKSVELPNDLRAPECESAVDFLVLVLLPPWQGSKPELVPAFISFRRTGLKAGQQLATTIKLASHEDAWSKIHSIGSNTTTKGGNTWAVPTVRTIGYGQAAVWKLAEELYIDSATKKYTAAEEDQEADPGFSGGPPREGEEPPPEADSTF